MEESSQQLVVSEKEIYNVEEKPKISALTSRSSLTCNKVNPFEDPSLPTVFLGCAVLVY